MQYRNVGKRILDLTIVIFFLALLGWVVALIILLYLLIVEWPIFFGHRRSGKNGIPFTMWKFRTLSTDATLPLTQRSFPLGRWMRFFSLDELPQLWNVLKGEMSIVGPRPLPEEYTSLYSADQKRRAEVKPGITGWAQVNGRSSIPWNKKFEFDVYYVEHVSIKLDLLILLKTLTLVLSFRKDVSLEEEKFKGN